MSKIVKHPVVIHHILLEYAFVRLLEAARTGSYAARRTPSGDCLTGCRARCKPWMVRTGEKQVNPTSDLGRVVSSALLKHWPCAATSGLAPLQVNGQICAASFLGLALL